MIVDSDSLILFNGLSKNVGKENIFSAAKANGYQAETEHIYNKLELRPSSEPMPVCLPYKMPYKIEEDAQSCQSNRRSQPSMGVKAYALKNKMSVEYANTNRVCDSPVTPIQKPKANDHTYEVLSEAISKHVNHRRFQESSSPSSSSSCSSSPEITNIASTTGSTLMPFLDSVVEPLPMLSSTSISPSQMLDLKEGSVQPHLSPIKTRETYQFKSKLSSTLKSKKLRSLSNINFQKIVPQ